ncbi:MAG TPA: GNAT family N-acetyltransferase [Puia sp.]|nr:GNAT family N-acetyltransferase [Puia sp.]
MVRIIDFDKKYISDFRRLNEEWLDSYNLMESHDREVLEDPIGLVIDRGGFIFLAEEDGKIVGTAGLMKEHEGEYELVKMGVSPAYRGKGISKMLMEKCIGKARELGARRLFLFSNSRLKPAIALYAQYGFKHIPADDSPFLTADVKMEFRF